MSDTIENPTPAESTDSPKAAPNTVSPEEAQRNEERVSSLLEDAFTLASRGDYAMAIRLAQEAALVLPNATTAYSALSSFYERANKIPEAIAAQEKVVSLNPASEADRIKLESLQRGVHTLPRRSESVLEPDSAPKLNSAWLPILLASVLGVMVLILGLNLMSQQSERERQNRIANNRPAADATLVERNSAYETPRMLPPVKNAPTTPLPSMPIQIKVEPMPTRTVEPTRRRVAQSNDTVTVRTNRRTRTKGDGITIPGIGKIVSSTDKPQNNDDSLPLPGSKSSVEEPKVTPAPTTNSPNGSGVSFAPEVRKPYIRIEVKSAPTDDEIKDNHPKKDETPPVEGNR